MKKDGLEFFDKGERIVFNYYSFCEVLKGCISEYCERSREDAHEIIENAKLFEVPISDVNDVYFFSHEHPFHWSMVCLYGDRYWDEYPDLVHIPETYDSWEARFIVENNLEEEFFVFTDS
jgi:hypothetical protein